MRCYWAEPPPATVARGPLPKETDIAIVGSGFTGLAAALVLLEAGKSVCLFEAHEAGHGASTRNGGIASGNLAWQPSQLAARFGRPQAREITAEGMAARAHLAALIARLNITCDFAPSGRFRGATTPKAYEALAREAELLRGLGDIPVEMVARQRQTGEMGTERYFGGELRHDIGGLHPGHLHRGLLDRVTAAGGTLFDRTPVLGIDKRANGFDVRLAKATVRAGHVIAATNGYTDASLPWLRRRIIPIESQMIATEPLPPRLMAQLMPKGRMAGDTARLVNYFRPSPDGRRVLWGGRAGRGRHLGRAMAHVFPELAHIRITHSWTGFVAYSFGRMPHVAAHDGIIHAAAYCGSGVVWGPWLGRKAALKILGDAEGDSVFDRQAFETRPFYGGTPWFLPAAMAWKGFHDQLDNWRWR